MAPLRAGGYNARMPMTVGFVYRFLGVTMLQSHHPGRVSCRRNFSTFCNCAFTISHVSSSQIRFQIVRDQELDADVREERIHQDHRRVITGTLATSNSQEFHGH
jgi:hypothetical protein